MKIEINVVPGRGKSLDVVSVFEIDSKGKPKLITYGSSPQHHAFLQNVTKTLTKEADMGLWSVSHVGNKIFLVSI